MANLLLVPVYLSVIRHLESGVRPQWVKAA